MGIFKQFVLKDYENQIPYLMWMCSPSCVGIKTYTKMQSYFASPKDFYEAGEQKWEKCGILTGKQLELLMRAKKEIDPFVVYENMMRKGINILSIEEEKYPGKLKEIRDAPICLFYKGRLPQINVPQIAVIGARACTNYGILVAKKLGESLAEAQIGVISGMARGIDSQAQISAMMAGGYSLAVLGSGPDVVYPRESKGLYEMLERGGCILSEYVPGTPAKPTNFALRNRIISGLSDAVCVVEAKQKSGTMITVDCALEQGREVYVIPGRITDSVSRGCLELIRQGAGVVTGINEFVEEISDNYSDFAFSGAKLTGEKADGEKPVNKYTQFFEKFGENGRKVIENLSVESFNIDEIIKETGLDYGSVLPVLLQLEEEKILSNLGAGRFSVDASFADFIEDFRKNSLAS